MLKAHGVTITEEESLVKQATSKAMNMSIKESFKKADEEIQRREELKKDEVLSSLIKKDLILECLARLIVAHNLCLNEGSKWSLGWRHVIWWLATMKLL